MKKFRRIFALLMCVVLTLSLTACRIVIDGEENIVKKLLALLLALLMLLGLTGAVAAFFLQWGIYGLLGKK